MGGGVLSQESRRVKEKLFFIPCNSKVVRLGIVMKRGRNVISKIDIMGKQTVILQPEKYILLNTKIQ